MCQFMKIALLSTISKSCAFLLFSLTSAHCFLYHPIYESNCISKWISICRIYIKHVRNESELNICMHTELATLYRLDTHTYAHTHEHHKCKQLERNAISKNIEKWATIAKTLSCSQNTQIYTVCSIKKATITSMRNCCLHTMFLKNICEPCLWCSKRLKSIFIYYAYNYLLPIFSTPNIYAGFVRVYGCRANAKKTFRYTWTKTYSAGDDRA